MYIKQGAHRLENKLLDKAEVVDEYESPHQELTVHPINHTTVSGNQVAKVLNCQ